MAFSGPAEDRLAIRELYGAYSAAAMEQDREAYLSFWREDGVRSAPDGEAHGRIAIAAHWDRTWTMIDRMGFFGEVASIVVEGAQAVARVYCREIVVLKDGRTWKLIGRYDDRLAKADGRWQFSRRNYRIVLNETG